jgi:hypothetical protein
LQRHRQKDGECADVLDERGEQDDGEDQHEYLRARRRDVGRKRADRDLGHARARDGGAHDERGTDDDHHVVAESGERLLCRNDAAEHGCHQREQGHDIVAQASPHEEHHHDADDRERECLREGHALFFRWSRTGAGSGFGLR